MTRPTTSAKYPLAMLDAMRRAHAQGEFLIPTDNPAALRLRFYGLGGALRKENTPELFDALSFIVQKSPPALIIRLTENDGFALDIAAALNSAPVPSAASEAEDMLSRLLGANKP